MTAALAAPAIRPPVVLERRGRCVRLAQLPGGSWMSERDLRPCSCGHRVFVVTAAGRVLCEQCPRARDTRGQAVIYRILMPARSEVSTRKVHHHVTTQT